MTHAAPSGSDDEIDENTQLTVCTDLEFSILGTCVNALNMADTEVQQERVTRYLMDRYLNGGK